MAKLPHQSTVEPVEAQDVATKVFAESSGGGGGSGGGPPLLGAYKLTGTISNFLITPVPPGPLVTLDAPDDMTLEQWLKPASFPASSTTLRRNSSIGGATYNYQIRLLANTDIRFFYYGTQFGQSNNLDVSHVLTQDEWVHLAFVKTAVDGTVRFFVNGVFIGSDSGDTLGMATGGNSLSIGSNAASDVFDGLIAETRIWNVAKTDAEILQNFNYGLVGDEDNLIGYWRGDTLLTSLTTPDAQHTMVVTGDPTIIDVVPGRVTVHKIATANGPDLEFGNADAPTAGQVPTGDGAGNVTWEDQVGGGSSGPVTAAQGAFVRARLSSTQVDPGLNDACVWDTEEEIGGSDRITYNVANGQVTVKAGVTAFLMAQLHLEHTAIFGSTWGWYDVTAGAEVLGSRQYNRSTTASAQLSTTQNSSAVVRPLVETIYELRLLVVNTANVDVGVDATWLQVVEIGAVQANVIGGLEFMDIIEVTSDQTSVSFGASGDGAFQRALDGDVDGEYEISHYFPDPAATVFFSLRPNAAPSTYVSTRHFYGTGHGGSLQTDLLIGVPTSGNTVSGWASLKAQSGVPRAFRSDQFTNDAGGGRFGTHNVGHWTDTAANIDSLQIFSDTADGIKIGARFILWRRTTSNVRADSASIYERNVEAIVAQGTAAAQTYTTGDALFGGSAVGVNVSLIDDTVVSGSITVQLKVNDIVVLTATLDATNTSQHRAAAAAGAIKIVAGQAIEVDVTTTNLVTSGAPASPAISINLMLITDAFVQPPVGSAYLIASLEIQQTANIAIGDHIEFDKQSSRGTAITMSTGAGQLDGLFTLQPGKTYEIHASLQATTNEGASRSRWLLHPSNAILVDDTGDLAALHNHADDIGDLNLRYSSIHIFTPTVETTIKIALQSPVTNFTRWEEGSRVFIKELL